MKDLKTYVLEGFKLGKNKVDIEEDFVNLDLPSGTLWCKYNVGATCGYDAESWYGDYFMWGDTKPANSKTCNFANYKYCNGSYNKITKYCSSSQTYNWDGKGKPDDILELYKEDDMANANMDGNWKMPINEQFQELIDNTTSEWIKNYKGISGLNGRLFKSKKNSDTLFIPAAGYRNDNNVSNVGLNISVWSSTRGIHRPAQAYHLYSTNDSIYTRRGPRTYGFSVRAVIN